jgi:hypothetical protein
MIAGPFEEEEEEEEDSDATHILLYQLKLATFVL